MFEVHAWPAQLRFITRICNYEKKLVYVSEIEIQLKMIKVILLLSYQCQ